MNKTYYPRLDETLCKAVLPNGLTVLVVPKPGFTRKIAYFMTNYGSVHTAFTLDGKHYTTPAGVAHYLEHKMFDLPDRDVTEEFAALGASPNAFTSYGMTAYYLPAPTILLLPCGSCWNSCPPPILPRRVWKRSGASSPRRS